MSTNCIRCVRNRRTGSDLLCDGCRRLATGRGLDILLTEIAGWAHEFIDGSKGDKALEEAGLRSDSLMDTLINAAWAIKTLRSTSLDLIERGYKTANRTGWENGESTDEWCRDALGFLANHGRTQEAADAARKDRPC